MKTLTTIQYHNNPKSQTLDVILQGSSVGIETPFLQKVFLTCKEVGHSVIGFNFPYYERGENTSSGDDLKEEIASLEEVLEIAEYKKYKTIRLIGKSLGAIVASFYLKDLPPHEQKLFEVIVLGYVRGSIQLEKVHTKIIVIQGEYDKFGNIESVKKDLQNALSKEITYHEIPHADHSYRDSETKEPVYEDDVIEILRQI